MNARKLEQFLSRHFSKGNATTKLNRKKPTTSRNPMVFLKNINGVLSVVTVKAVGPVLYEIVGVRLARPMTPRRGAKHGK